VNVAGLMLARANARQADVAVRLALGAGWPVLARRMLVESFVLAGCGAVIGLALTWVALRVINAHVLPTTPELGPIGIEPVVLGVTVLSTVMVAVLNTLLPLMSFWRVNLLPSLQGSGRQATSGRRIRSARSVLIAAQVALALVLLVGAG